MTLMTKPAPPQTSHLVPGPPGAPILPGLCETVLATHGVTFAAAVTLIQQPPFTNALLTTLPQAQALAASHAQTFVEGWHSGVANGVFGALETLATEVAALLGDDTLKLARKLDATDPRTPDFAAALAEFRDILNALTLGPLSLATGSGSTLLRIKSISDTLADLSRQIGDDATKLGSAVHEVDREGRIARLINQQAALQGQLAEANDAIAKGATEEIGPSILFGFEISKEFMNGVDAGALGGATLGIVGQAMEIAAYNEKVKAQYDQQDALIAQIGALASRIAATQTDAMTLSLVSAQIDVFASETTRLVAAARSIDDQLAGMSRQIGALGIVETPPFAGYYAEQVQVAQDFWRDLGAQSKRYLSVIAHSKEAETP
ncbi:MAG: hypothetical protein AAFU82_15710 [Pseudomonadota bacterium]